MADDGYSSNAPYVLILISTSLLQLMLFSLKFEKM
jgi:hypothetical protein